MTNRFETLRVPGAVALGGALGSVLRWSLASGVANDGFPWATFITNISGAFVLGVVLVAGEVIGHPSHRHHRRSWALLWRPFMATGVLGGFTTFSTFVLEADRLESLEALTYVGTSVGLGLLAYASGNAVARRLFGVRA